MVADRTIWKNCIFIPRPKFWDSLQVDNAILLKMLKLMFIRYFFDGLEEEEGRITGQSLKTMFEENMKVQPDQIK